jgi:hypothetical protein
MSVAWFIFGASVLLIPLYFNENEFIHFEAKASESIGGFGSLLGSVVAGLVGAVFSCIWFGWYLGIAFLIFDGHNNEVGGAVRIENFKQFIRFRLTENTLTGYVIAVDDVSMIGNLFPERKGIGKERTVGI